MSFSENKTGLRTLVLYMGGVRKAAKELGIGKTTLNDYLNDKITPSKALLARIDTAAASAGFSPVLRQQVDIGSMLVSNPDFLSPNQREAIERAFTERLPRSEKAYIATLLLQVVEEYRSRIKYMGDMLIEEIPYEVWEILRIISP